MYLATCAKLEHILSLHRASIRHFNICPLPQSALPTAEYFLYLFDGTTAHCAKPQTLESFAYKFFSHRTFPLFDFDFAAPMLRLSLQIPLYFVLARPRYFHFLSNLRMLPRNSNNASHVLWKIIFTTLVKLFRISDAH